MRGAVTAFLFGVALITSTPATGRADDRHVYEDKDHHDTHEWNAAEERAWRHWLTEEHHGKYHAWDKASARERSDYWKWRHEHADWH
jgi:hypothetical protein